MRPHALRLLVLASLLLLWAAAARGFAQESIAELVARAGNAEEETTRYALLRRIESHPDLTPQQGEELRGLLFVAGWWAEGRERWLAGERWPGAERDLRRAAENGYLCGWFHDKIRPADSFPGKVAEDSPLHPLWCLYRGRLLIQMPIQNSGLRERADMREAYFGQGRRLLSRAAEAFPENRLIGMYLGRPIPWPALEPDPGAPRWANLQRELLHKLTEIIHFWIDERQLPDGQFGGGWGDDCEMWRWWTPVLMGFEDEKAIASQTLISDAIMALPHMRLGYSSIMDDVEHTSEDSMDSITPMMLLTPEDPVWKARALRLADLMRSLWTARNERDQRMFRSTYFTSAKVDESPKRACDTVWHPLAVGPALLYWQRSGNEELGTLFTDWLDTWVDATAREERGKPAGILPSAIHFPGGEIGGLGQNWWQPENYFTRMYDWPTNSMNRMTDALLLAWHMSSEERYLQPLRSMAAHRRAFIAAPQDNPPPGGLAWCASQLGVLAPSLAKYRLVSGNPEFDDLIRHDADGYTRFRVDGDVEALEEDLERSAIALRRNRPAFTTEVRYTDRVLAFTRTYESFFPDAPPRMDWALLLGTLTGSAGDPRIFPISAVRWLTPPSEIAALVTESTTREFSAKLYHFGEYERPLRAELFLLEPGDYRVDLLTAEGELLRSSLTRLSGRRARLQVELPPRRLCTLRVSRAEPRAMEGAIKVDYPMAARN